jgi:hypothetical protein
MSSSKPISTKIEPNQWGQLQATTEYKADETPMDYFVEHSSGKDEEYYPGTLNKSLDGSRIINAHSSESDYKNSSIQSAHNMGVAHASEIGLSFNDPNFTAADASPMGFNADNPTAPKDRGPLLAKLGAELQKNPDLDTSNILGLNHEINPKSFLPDINPYALVGDPRWSLGAAMQTMYQKVLPEITDFLKSVTPRATYVNEYGQVCDEDGNPISSETDPNINPYISFDMNGVIDYTKVSSALKKPPTVEYIKSIFINSKNEAFRKSADAFLKYLHVNFLDIPPETVKYTPDGKLPHVVKLPWKPQPVYLQHAGSFFVKLTQEVIEKDPAQRVIIVSEDKLAPYTKRKAVIGEFFMPAGISRLASEAEAALSKVEKGPPLMDVLDPIGSKLFNAITGFGHKQAKKMRFFYVYEFMNNYVEEEEPDKKNPVDNSDAYNPYGIPERDDPDAPAPKAVAQVTIPDPLNFGKLILVTPAYPPGKAGKIETVDMNFLFKRYYPDQKEYIAEKLGVPLVYANNVIADRKHISSLAALADPVPDYLLM